MNTKNDSWLESPAIFLGILGVSVALAGGLYFGLREPSAPRPGPNPAASQPADVATPTVTADPNPPMMTTPEPEASPDVVIIERHRRRPSTIEDIGRANREAALNAKP